MKQSQNYHALIRTLKTVIDRHAKRLTSMKEEELNVFIAILTDLMTLLHSKTNINLNQTFESSVISQYLEMVKLITNHDKLSLLLNNKSKINILTISIIIYFHYSRFKQCEDIIHDAIDLCQLSGKHWVELIKLMVLRTHYVSFAAIDAPHKNGQENIKNIDDMIQIIRTNKSWKKYRKINPIKNNKKSNKNHEQKEQEQSIDINDKSLDLNGSHITKMPIIYDLFCRFLQISLRLKFDQSHLAAKLLLDANKDLIKLIQEKDDKDNTNNKENRNRSNGRKRKLDEIEIDEENKNDNNNNNDSSSFERPRKRQKLNNKGSNGVYSNNSNSHSICNSEMINDPDICFLINFAGLLTLNWITRNASFEHEALRELKDSVAFLIKSNKADVNEKDMSFFEAKLMQFFKEKNKTSQTMKDIEDFSKQIDGKYFKKTLIPLLKRVNYDYNNIDKSKLYQHINWLNINGLNELIEKLFYGLQSMHCGKMKDAQKYMLKIQEIMNKSHKSNSSPNSNSESVDFGILNLQFLIWNLSCHLSLCQHGKLPENMLKIVKMMQYNDGIKDLLNKNYCSQKLFKNTCRAINVIDPKKSSRSKKSQSSKSNKNPTEQTSTMRLHNDERLIIFDESKCEMKLSSSIIKQDNEEYIPSENNDKYLWIESITNSLKNGDISNVDQFKSFLRMASMNLHYLASHVSLIIHEQKCTRNQIKRCHKLTLKNVDVSSRFYIRLILEILRHGAFTEKDKDNHKKREEIEKSFESIFNYIKMIFNQNKNTVNILPFVAICTIYAYCTVDDEMVVEFNENNKKDKKNKKRKKKDKNTKNMEIKLSENMIKRRITFLKFMLMQLLKERTQSCYFHIITSTFIYLYKLMEKCKEYKTEKNKMKKFLEKWLPKEYKFINEQFNDCIPIKRTVARSMKAFKSKIGNKSMEKELNENNEENDYVLKCDKTVKKCIVDYNDHLYVAKH